MKQSEYSNTFRFYCRCGQRLKAPAAARGKRARCPKCGSECTVPWHATDPERGSTLLSSLRAESAVSF
jgi:uncharacterized paraquat-inducible protein A